MTAGTLSREIAFEQATGVVGAWVHGIALDERDPVVSDLLNRKLHEHGVLFFQLVNLPVEFDASARAKRMLNEWGMVDGAGATAVNSVLNAAAWTYVAATLQTLLTLLYYVLQFSGGGRDDRS